MEDVPSISHLLSQVATGDPAARESLLPLVYAELRRIAARHMRRERGDHTLQPTALVNEVYVRLFQGDGMEWSSRSHFFAIASREMRHVLVDYARQHRAKKRGGGVHHIELEEAFAYTSAHAEEMLALDQ